MADDHIFRSLDLPAIDPDAEETSTVAGVNRVSTATERALVDIAQAQATQNRHLKSIAGSVGFIAVVVAIFAALTVIGFLISLAIALSDDDNGGRFNAIPAPIVRSS